MEEMCVDKLQNSIAVSSMSSNERQTLRWSASRETVTHDVVCSHWQKHASSP
jgi:hypothetical protein